MCNSQTAARPVPHSALSPQALWRGTTTLFLPRALVSQPAKACLLCRSLLRKTISHPIFPDSLVRISI